MPILKEKFDGLRENHSAERKLYYCTYICRGVVNTSEFPASFEWKCKRLSNPFARLINLETDGQLSTDLHEMTATYSTLPDDCTQRAADRQQPANPLARAVRRRWSIGAIDTYPQRDLDNKPIMARNDEPFRGGIPVKEPYLILRYTRNEAYFNEAAALQVGWATNAAKDILCTRFEADEQLVDSQTNISYVQVEYEFWKKPTGTWDERRLNAGSFWITYNVETDEWDPHYLEDEEGVKAFADGAILLTDIGDRLPKDGEPIYLSFRPFRTADLAALGLPGIS